jgi:hypothetical protein
MLQVQCGGYCTETQEKAGFPHGMLSANGRKER